MFEPLASGNRKLCDSRITGAGLIKNFGGPGGARTPNPQFRRLMLYPIELRGRYQINVPVRRPATSS
jgi:hypothetical protein